MITYNDVPRLPSQDTRPVHKVDARELSNICVNTFAYSMQEGDVIEFDKTDTPIVVGQPIRERSNVMVYYVACKRNGRPSWITVSTFTKRDADNNPCGPIEALGMAQANFAMVYANVLSGRKLTARTSKKVRFAKYRDGVRLSETIERTIPVLEYMD